MHIRTYAHTHTGIGRHHTIATPASKVDELCDGLNQLLDFTRQVQAVDTAGVEPLHTVLEVPLPLRPDVAVQPVADILQNAPQEFERFFVAPLEQHFDGDADGNGEGED